MQETSAVVSVLGMRRLRLVTSYHRGIPVLFPALAEKHDITPEKVTRVRNGALGWGGLSQEGEPFEMDSLAEDTKFVDELRRVQASYMEMAIKDDDLRVLKIVYKLHKGGISSEHPRFGFRRPMRMAAACGRLEMLKWLGEQEERDEWLQDSWLLDDAIQSCRLDVAQWVHLSYRGEPASNVTFTSLHKAASEGAVELLRWALAMFPDAQFTTDAMDGVAANGHLEIVRYLHTEREEGCTTAAMDKAAGNGHLAVVEYLHTHRQEGCTVRAMNNAAGNGHLHVIKFLHENREEGCTDKAIKEAAAGGHLEVIRFLHESRDADFTEEAMDWAICKGLLDVAKYLYEQQCRDGDYLFAVRVALGSRHLSLVRFACEHFHANLSAAELEGARFEGLLEIIHVFEQFNVDGWTTEVMDHAADIEILEAVRYLHSHRTEGCTTEAMDNAVSNGIWK